MFTKLPMYQQQGKTAFKKDLTNSIALSKHLNNPENKFASIHVAGTNGKGSTSHMIASVLQESGYKVGLYTSPHLKDFRERIRINGISTSKQNVVDFITKNKTFLENQQVSFFEMTVGLAFHTFAAQNVDIAIIEVGLGGRLDSTNIIQPLVSVITNIGLEHTQFLGETLEEIAFEKGGIIKPNTPVIIGEKQSETSSTFQEIAKKNNATLYFAENLVQNAYPTDLLGDYQTKNVKTAMATLQLLAKNNLKISEKQIQKGLLHVAENTHLKGRWQVLGKQPTIICDTAHNKEGLKIVLEQLKKQEYEQLHIVLGLVTDKNLETILPLFPEKGLYYFCKPNIPRGMDAKLLQQKANSFQLQGDNYKSVSSAYKSALKKASFKDLIYIGGSTFVVAELPL